MDPAPLLERSRAMGKRLYLPVLVSPAQGHMLFAPYEPDTALAANRFGIPEPVVTAERWVLPQRLDLVLTPLVAFDTRGNRLGMGGGYYDRTFAFRRHPGHIARPHLLGLAYEMQKTDALVRRAWDVPLDGVVTETAFYPVPQQENACPTKP
jgi:5-formyltetrahydrofolate cyclo-ligase